MRILVQLIGWLLPMAWRKALYAKAFGWKFEQGSQIGRSLFFCANVVVGEEAGIGDFNVIRHIDSLILHDHAYLCHLNWVTGFPTADKRAFSDVIGRKCELEIGSHSSITSQHFIDCTGGVRIGAFTTVGGVRSQILTHYIDPYESHQTCKPITIGDYCFVGTGSLLLPGSAMPDYSILGGGSVLTKEQKQSHALYAGNPATVKKDLSGREVKYFMRKYGCVL